MVVVRLPKSLVSPLQDCLTPYILTSITPPWSKNLVIEGPIRLLQHYQEKSGSGADLPPTSHFDPERT